MELCIAPPYHFTIQAFWELPINFLVTYTIQQEKSIYNKRIIFYFIEGVVEIRMEQSEVYKGISHFRDKQ